MEIEKKLKDIFNIILDEMKTNKDFANRIEKVLGKEEVVVKAKKRGRQPALFNPNIVALEEEGKLKVELENLEVAQLKDIISQYGMDPSKMTSRWRSKEKFMKHIIEVTLSRINKGNSFK